MRLRESDNHLQLPLFSFFLPAVSRTSEFSICLPNFENRSVWWTEAVSSVFLRYSCNNVNKNWYLHFHKAYDHQIWQAGTSRGIDPNETNQLDGSDVITSRSLKYPNYQNAYGHQTWQDGGWPLGVPTHNVTWHFGHMILWDHVTLKPLYIRWYFHNSINHVVPRHHVTI